MATVLLGNTAPVEAPIGTSVKVNDELIFAPDAVAPSAVSQATVFIDTPDHDADGNPVPLDKKLAEIRHAFSVHSTGTPVWVEGHDDFFNQVVAQSFGCPVGRPADWDAAESPQEPAEEPVPLAAVPVVAEVQVEAQEA